MSETTSAETADADTRAAATVCAVLDEVGVLRRRLETDLILAAGGVAAGSHDVAAQIVAAGIAEVRDFEARVRSVALLHHSAGSGAPP